MNASSDRSDIELLREKIDALDASILKLLAERFATTRAIGVIKSKENWPAQDTGREAQQFENLIALAREHDVPEALVQMIYRNIIDTVVSEHRER